MIALRKLSDAIRKGDKILAVIRGSGVTQEGLSKSLGTPTGNFAKSKFCFNTQFL